MKLFVPAILDLETVSYRIEIVAIESDRLEICWYTSIRCNYCSTVMQSLDLLNAVCVSYSHIFHHTAHFVV